MKITVLGNGGFYNEGLFYNALAIDARVLVETPPDILQSIARQAMRPAQFDTVFVSHIHGDHCFGFPFFFFNWLYAGEAHSHWHKGSVLTLIGPNGLGEQLRVLLRMAIPHEHPYTKAFEQRVRLVEVGEEDIVDAGGGLWFGFMAMKHSLPTMALIVGEQGLDVARSTATSAEAATHSTPDSREAAAHSAPASSEATAHSARALPAPAARFEKARFIYSSDTSMFEGVSRLIESGARLVLCDTNGEKENEVHMSPKELAMAARGRPGDIASGRIRGIHMSRSMKRLGDLSFVQPGDTFILE